MAVPFRDETNKFAHFQDDKTKRASESLWTWKFAKSFRHCCAMETSDGMRTRRTRSSARQLWQFTRLSWMRSQCSKFDSIISYQRPLVWLTTLEKKIPFNFSFTLLTLGRRDGAVIYTQFLYFILHSTLLFVITSSMVVGSRSWSPLFSCSRARAFESILHAYFVTDLWFVKFLLDISMSGGAEDGKILNLTTAKLRSILTFFVLVCCRIHRFDKAC